MSQRDKYPPTDFELRHRRGDEETWEQAAQYEAAYQLARIAQALEGIRWALPSGGRGL
jgi:hypothetical protein